MLVGCGEAVQQTTDGIPAPGRVSPGGRGWGVCCCIGGGGVSRGCCAHGQAAAPWPEKLRRGRWRRGKCTDSGRGRRRTSGRRLPGSCSGKPRWRLGTSAGDAKTSHCETTRSAPEMKKPLVEPEQNNNDQTPEHVRDLPTPASEKTELTNLCGNPIPRHSGI